ncbi:MAG: rhodanese-like domain-containing protein [Candidatus Zixiibacteriota bacterium]|nr:MAG: rhodanese-like domain-containing protein [candidate division Zixibacteria bacterium]
MVTISLLSPGGCSKRAVPSVSVEELHGLIEEGRDIFLLDVRRQEEYAAGRLSSIDLRIPHDSLEGNLDLLPQDKLTCIYCICRGGVRSGTAVEYLRSVGYDSAFNVAGGMLAWQELGYETVADSL